MAKRPRKVVVFRTKDDRFAFHQVAGNGEITAPSQTYSRRWTAHRAVIELFGPSMTIVDEYDPTKERKPRGASKAKA